MITDGKILRGACIAHHGHTLHGSFPNSSNRQRRAWILNFRPSKVITYMRSIGFDHLGDRENRNEEQLR